MWTLKYLSLRHIRNGEWALWDLNPGTFGYEPTDVTCSAKGPQVILFTTSLYIMYYNITSKFCQQIFLLFSSFFLLSSLITLTILPHITKFVNTFFLFFFNFFILFCFIFFSFLLWNFRGIYYGFCFKNSRFCFRYLIFGCI